MSIVIAGAIVIYEALHQDSWWYAIEAIFRSNPGIGATEHGSEWILSCAERLAFMREVVAKGHASDVAVIAFHEAIEGRVGGDDVLRFRGRLVVRGHRPWDNQARR
jgi:hypothetical protein